MPRDHRQFDSVLLNQNRVRIWSGNRSPYLLGLVPAGTAHEPPGRIYSPTLTGRATFGLRAWLAVWRLAVRERIRS